MVVGAQAVSAAPQEVRVLAIGQSLPMVGEFAEAALAVEGSAKAAVGEINAAGGIGGVPVRIVSLDAAGQVKQHRQNLRQLINQHQAVTLIRLHG